MFSIFETIAVVLYLALDNIFYLLNFSCIGGSIAPGLMLYIKKVGYAGNVVQFLVGSYMLIYLGIICRENMQIEGFWYYLFLGVFEAAVFLKPAGYFSLFRVRCDKMKCISCGKCRDICPMNVDMLDGRQRRKNGTECILCCECIKACLNNALNL